MNAENNLYKWNQHDEAEKSNPEVNISERKLLKLECTVKLDHIPQPGASIMKNFPALSKHHKTLDWDGKFKIDARRSCTLNFKVKFFKKMLIFYFATFQISKWDEKSTTTFEREKRQKVGEDFPKIKVKCEKGGKLFMEIVNVEPTRLRKVKLCV